MRKYSRRTANRRHKRRSIKLKERCLNIMAAQSIIVWDLETVPDLAGFAAANNLVGQTDAHIRSALGNNSQSTSITRSCASARSLRTAKVAAGRWMR